MAPNTREQESWLVELADQLTTEFDGVLPADVVSATVVSAKNDLAGQVAPEAQDEMAYRLARYRLDRLIPAS